MNAMTLASLRQAVRRLAKGSRAAQKVTRQSRRRFRRPRWPAANLPAPGTSTADRNGEKQRVLVGTSIGGFLTGLTLESALAVALRERGADVEALLCDADLTACLECTIQRLGDSREMAEHGPRRHLCPGCFATGRRTYDEIGVQVQRYGRWISDEERDRARKLAGTTPYDELGSVVLDGLAIGEHALAGALRFFARADLEGEPDAEPVLRRYVESAAVTAFALRRLLRSQRYDVAVFHHGIYVPQGILGEVCRQEGVRVVTWNPAYRKNCFVFSHDDTYHHTLMDEPVEMWADLPWSEETDQRLEEYLLSRWSGSKDWIWFHSAPTDDLRAIEAECGVDFSRPVIGLLTNVMWDAQLHYPSNAFSDMREWIVRTVDWFADHPELQLLIRVHPAEIRGGVPSRQLVAEELAHAYPALPPNVHVLGPESPASTYVAMAQCDTVLIYGTKTGVELTAMGIPVVVAGEAWIRGKGLTRDATDPASYERILESLPVGERLAPEVVVRARKYAYHFFFRRMIEVGFVEPTHGDPVFRLAVGSHSERLRPGVDAGLDCICEGILTGSPFVSTVHEHHLSDQ